MSIIIRQGDSEWVIVSVVVEMKQKSVTLFLGMTRS